MHGFRGLIEMKLYVLTWGFHDDRSLLGVFSTPEKAMAARPSGYWQKLGKENSWHDSAGAHEIEEVTLDHA